MPFSLTYLGVATLTYLGLENAQEVVEAIMVLIVAGITLYGRYRAGGLDMWGTRKW